MVKRKISLGAALITRDAEEDISKAIESARGVCEQVVVVDTGSSDSTPKIAARLGAEVYFFKWRDDFSAARNSSLNFLRTDWALIIDSDERLDVKSLKDNLYLLENPNIGGVRVEIVNVLEDGETASKHDYTRIFRAAEGIRFEGAVHEQIAPSIRAAGYEIVDSGVKLYHYGYMRRDNDKIERNRELLTKELENKPEDDWLIKHLAETEFTAGNYDKAAELFTRVIDSPELSESDNANAKIRLGQIALKRDEYDRTIELLDFESADADLEGLKKYVAAVAFAMRKDYGKARELINCEEAKRSDLVNQSDLKDAIETLNRVAL